VKVCTIRNPEELTVTDLSSRPEISVHSELQAARRFETPGAAGVRQVYFHDPDAPPAAVVAPSVFVVARDERDSVLLVRRRDSGLWELPGGRVDVGESAVDALSARRSRRPACGFGSSAWSVCSPIRRTSCGRPPARSASSSSCASAP
jgi:NUDIX domain